MKVMILLLLLPAIASAESLKLARFDQLKLAELVARLPSSVRAITQEEVSHPAPGRRITSRLPIAEESSSFQIICHSTYFHDSPYASEADCSFEVNLSHKDLQSSYDELLVKIKNSALNEALYAGIPHGVPRREFRSFGKDKGTTFEGTSGQIFHYYLSCSEAQCILKVSEKNLQ